MVDVAEDQKAVMPTLLKTAISLAESGMSIAFRFSRVGAKARITSAHLWVAFVP